MFKNYWIIAYRNFRHQQKIAFVADILVTLVITLLTLGAHTFKAANADPVRSIRNE